MNDAHCTIDERDQDPNLPLMAVAQRMVDAGDLLGQLIAIRENIPLGFYVEALKRELAEWLSLLAYAVENPSRRKRTNMEDPKKMATKWLPLVRQLAIGHDVDAKDQASAALDELLLPIIAAPVDQIRTFYRELVRLMKADQSIPWAVWRLFEFWGTNVLDKIEREKEFKLKAELARKIAESAYQRVPVEDWIASMAGALQWRDEETLKRVDNAIVAGAKPRVKGRESCLFLEVAGAEVML